MKILKANPGARRLIESLRNMGYDCSAAIADLVDNSIAAHASEIHIDIFSHQDSKPAAILIADNGKGMDRDDLHEAMRFGAYQEYSDDDLGKYGLGLKTASLSQCRTLTVSSKAKNGSDKRPRRIHMRWDIEHVYKTDDWDLLAPTDSELKSWEVEMLNHNIAKENGTVVLWTNLEETLTLLSASDPREREKFLAILIEDISKHLGMVFHRFMQGSVPGHRKLNIFVCGVKLLPWDPFCRDEDTKELEIIRLPVISVAPDGSKIKDTVMVSPFILPREDEFSSPLMWRNASGPRNWNQQQGFYFYRNNRLLQAGGWSWLRSVDEHTKLLRVAVDFSRNLDRAFAINITKMRAMIPPEIREKVASGVTIWAKKARERYDRRPVTKKAGGVSAEPIIIKEDYKEEPINSFNIGPLFFVRNSDSKLKKILISRGGKTGHMRIQIPRGHELEALFSRDAGEDLKRLCLATLGILEALYEKKMVAGQIPLAALKKAFGRYL